VLCHASRFATSSHRDDFHSASQNQSFPFVLSPDSPPQRWTTVRHVLLYGALGGLLFVALQLIEYRYLIVTHSFEIYGGLIAVIFVTLGIWLGLTLTGRPERIVVQQVEIRVAAAPVAFSIDPAKREALGVTKRELEILGLMADGLSNKEIADRIFISENTVKTHSSRLFEKLGARRRTQAIQVGKASGLIP
jgi:DNA-binding CsgD family transcriptional regulator